MSKVHSVEGLFGGYDHFDDDGNYIGSSLPGLFGCTDHFNSEGKHIGYSIDGIIADSVHHLDDGSSGYSVDGLFSTHTYMDNFTADTYPDVFGYTTDIDMGW